MSCSGLLERNFHELIGRKEGFKIGDIKHLYFTVNNFLHYIKNSIDDVESVKREDIRQLLSIIDLTIQFPAKFLKASLLVLAAGVAIWFCLRVFGQYDHVFIKAYEGALGIVALSLFFCYRIFDAQAAKKATEFICKIWEMIDNYYQLQVLEIHEDIELLPKNAVLTPPRN